MLKACVYLSVISYAFAIHNFIPNDVGKKTVYTNFVPPSAERFFLPAPAAAVQTPSASSSAKAAAAPLIQAQYVGPYASPYPYQTATLPAAAQFSPFAFKQYPYYPGVFYPPQQYVYPSPVAPSPVAFIPRYPTPAESGSGSTSSGGWGSYFPNNWGNYWPSNWPSFSGSGSETGSSPGTPAESSSSQGTSSASNKVKPEKLESANESSGAETAPAAATQSQDSSKLDSDKNSVAVELPEQQYVLLGEPQFFGHFAAFPSDRDPTTLHGASKGAISSFLFYKDQSQQVVPQKYNDIANVPGSASLAYQRFLLLSKQRSEDGPKPTSKTEISSSSSQTSLNAQKDAAQQSENNSNSTVSASTATATEQNSSDKSSDVARVGTGAGAGGEIAQVTPNAVAYAGIGGIAGAAPVGTAYIANIGLASSAPRATAIAGTSDQTVEFSVVPAKTISVARYTPQRKYHIDTVVI